MSDQRSWDDDDRPSWRERDKMRERSTHRRDEKPAFSGTKQQQAWGKTQAVRAANALFDAKKTPELLQAEKALLAAKGTPGFEAQALKFFDTFGVTADWRIQLLLTESNASTVAVPAIEALEAGVGNLTPPEQRNVVTRLKMLIMTGKMKVKKAAKQALTAYE